MHISGEDAPRRDGLAHGLVVAVVAPDDHLVRHARERRHVPAVLVQQEGQILAGLQVLLLDHVVVSRQGVDLGMVIGGRLHDLPDQTSDWIQGETKTARQARTPGAA